MGAAGSGPGQAGEPRQAATVHVRDAQGFIIGDGGQLTNVYRGPGRIAATAYLEQVRDIAPLTLEARTAEIDELRAFCTGPVPGGAGTGTRPPAAHASYLWWQAGPWAGKTALMSSFVLDPPPGTDVVCFFVTARLAAQADSTAFTEALLEQLASLLGEDLPASTATANRDAHRRLLLRTAAQRSHAEGRRLVLVIDGLDEDQSGQAAESLPSIASLLPRHPEEGLRVIVSGRPHPDIPVDVAGDHPLRHCTVRHLQVSPYASDIMRLAKGELWQLLRGPDETGRDLLGLVTAAQGGLTLADLESLTRLAPHKIESILAGVTGRTIMGRTVGGPAADATRDRVYLLAHETLRAEAAHTLGDSLNGYRQRIHKWAKRYRKKHWPEDTPAYLLRGYPQMLRATKDRVRLTALALDESRGDRLLRSVGGDGSALAEITAAQELTAAAASPDFESALHLAARRDDLLARNEQVPSVLPAVWAMLGHPLRAEAHARSVGDPAGRADALTRLVLLLAEAGEHEQACRLAPDAITATRSAGDADIQGQFLFRVVRGTVISGDFDLALTASRGIRDPFWHSGAVTALALALAAAGRHDEAIAAADAVEDAAAATALLTQLVKECLAAEKHDEARSAYELAASAAASIIAGEERTRALADIAAAMVTTGGLPEPAAQAMAQAAVAARQLADPVARDELLADLVFAIAPRDPGSARKITDTIADPYWQAKCLVKVTACLAASAELASARVTARDALLAAAAIDDTYWHTEVIADLTSILASAGLPELAITAAESVRDACARTTVLCDLGISLAKSGSQRDTERLVASSISSALLIGDPAGQADAWPRLVRLLAAAGDTRRALDAAGLVTDPYWRARVLAGLLRELLAAGDHESAAQAEAAAEAAAGSIADPLWRSRALGGLDRVTAPAASPAGANQDADDAEFAGKAVSAVRRLGTPVLSELALVRVTCALARAGRTSAAALAAEAIDAPVLRSEALTEVAEGIAVHDTSPHAVDFINREISDAGWQAHALRKVAALRAADRTIGAVPGEWVMNTAMLPAAWAEVVRELPAPEHIARAAAEARSLVFPADRAEAIAQLAWALVTAGQHAEALSFATEAEAAARDVSGGSRLTVGLADLVEPLCDAGKVNQAWSAANAIADEDNRSRALATVFRAMMDAGSYADAVSVAKMITWEVNITAAATELAGKGEYGYAMELIHSGDRSDRDWRTASVAMVMAERGDYGEAIAVARTIESPAAQAESFADLAQRFAQAGQQEHAASAAAAAVSAAERSDGSPASLHHVLVSLLSIGAREQTAAMVQVINRFSDQGADFFFTSAGIGVLEAANSMVSLDYSGAIRAASTVVSGYRVSLISAIIKRLAATEEREYLKAAIATGIHIAYEEYTQATGPFPPFEPFSHEDQATACLTKLLAEVTQERSIIAAHDALPRDQKLEFLAAAARAVASADDAVCMRWQAPHALDPVIQSLYSIPSTDYPVFRNSGEIQWLELVTGESLAKRREAVRERELQEARESIAAVVKGERESWELASEMRAILRVAEPQWAIGIARDISQPHHRAAALVAIALPLAEADEATARQLTMEALMAGPWTMSLPLAARLAPKALSAFTTKRLARLTGDL